jgi:hypothetical protein
MFNAIILICFITEFDASTNYCANIDLGYHRTERQCMAVVNERKQSISKRYVEDETITFVLLNQGFCLKQDTPS